MAPSALAIAGLVFASIIFLTLNIWFWSWLYKYVNRKWPSTVVLSGESAFPPGYNFCGPGTRLKDRSSTQPVNALDEACRRHDEAYANENATPDDIHKADLELRNAARTVPLKTANEARDAQLIHDIMDFKARVLPKGAFSRARKKK